MNFHFRTNFVVFFTTAPAKHDLPTTRAIEDVGRDRLGRTLRMVGTTSPEIAALQAAAYSRREHLVIPADELRFWVETADVVLCPQREKDRQARGRA